MLGGEHVLAGPPLPPGDSPHAAEVPQERHHRCRWRERQAAHTGDVRVVGVQGVSEEFFEYVANFLCYDLVTVLTYI